MNSEEIKAKALVNKKGNQKFLEQLKKKNPRKVDAVFHAAHEKVFSCTDCLKCANCCKTTGPLFTDKDVERISKFLKIKSNDFINKYLRIDEDQDLVLQKVPCAFLDAENYCSIYDVRPKACREYPHTDRVKQQQLFKLTLKNTEICPAVTEILDEVKQQFPI